MIGLWCWLACQSEPAAPEVSVFEPLDDARLARRISIDLRGQLPTVAEIERANAGELDTLVDEWMAAPAFEAHLADVFTEAWLLDLDTLRIAPSEFGLSDEDDTYTFTRAFGGEPAHLVARVAADDRPWTDIVTGDTTMVDATLAALLNVEYLSDADAGQLWREARYVDGRPAGGVLMTSGLWLRYHTTLFNYNRGRAAALARLLLCYDFLARPVGFEASSDSSTEAQENAIATQDGCIACHATLDPLAATLFGFWPFEDKDGRELVDYHPEREGYAALYTGRSPGYFGVGLDGPAQLGPMVAADPRFTMCTATRTAERLWGRETTTEDLPEIVALRDALNDGDLQYKALLRAVMDTEEYRAGGLSDAASADELDRLHPLRTFTPLTMASVIDSLTGYRWQWAGWDELESDNTGYRLLFGGADGDGVKTSTLEPGLSRSLVLRRLAQSAAATVVAADLAAAPEARRLLGRDVSGTDFLDPGTEAFATALADLHLRLFATAATEAQIAKETSFFEDVLAAGGDPATAWTSLISVLLRDPDFWTY